MLFLVYGYQCNVIGIEINAYILKTNERHGTQKSYLNSWTVNHLDQIPVGILT